MKSRTASRLIERVVKHAEAHDDPNVKNAFKTLEEDLTKFQNNFEKKHDLRTGNLKAVELPNYIVIRKPVFRKIMKLIEYY